MTTPTQEEIKSELTKIKESYSGSPFTDNGDVTVQFMFYVVEYFLTIQKNTLAAFFDKGAEIGDMSIQEMLKELEEILKG